MGKDAPRWHLTGVRATPTSDNRAYASVGAPGAARATFLLHVAGTSRRPPERVSASACGLSCGDACGWD